MPDVPEKRISLAEMARVAQQKSLRPPADSSPGLTPPPMPPVRSVPPAPPPMFPSSPPAAPNGSMRTGDSGMIHLHELTSSPAIEPEPANPPAAASSTAAVLVEQPRVERVASSRPARRERRGMSWLLVGGAVVLVGAAIAGVAAKKGMTARDAAQRVAAVFKPAPAAGPITPFQPSEENPAALPAAQHVPGTPQPAAPANAAAAPTAAATTGGAKPPAAAHATATAKTEKAPAKAEVQAPTVPEKTPTANTNPLANAMQKAAAPQTGAGNDVPPPPVRAETTPLDVPEIPPQGAILGAIGAKRQAARACVKGLDGPSRATLVFASSGKVQSVSVSGPAAGTPAEACLKSVFMKATVEPFHRATYTSSTTVSP